MAELVELSDCYDHRAPPPRGGSAQHHPDHLGWHKSHKNYALAKVKLFDNMVDDDLVVVDVEDAGIHEFDEYIYTPGRRICKVAFDEPEGEDAAFVRDGKMVVRLKGVETRSSLHPSSRSRAITMSSMPYVPPRLLWPSVPIPRAFAAVWHRSSRSNTAWNPVARSMACATSTIPRQRTPMQSKRL
ncbi:MAG: Mur ligase family protein [Collinsella sp.]